MSGVTEVVADTVENVSQLASRASRMDSAVCSSRLAIVATTDFLFGMGRLYKTLREFQPGSTKQVEVFTFLRKRAQMQRAEIRTPGSLVKRSRAESGARRIWRRRTGAQPV